MYIWVITTTIKVENIYCLPQKVPSCSFDINSLISRSRQLLTCFMSVPILEFSTFGLLQYDSCVWLHLFSMMVLRFIQVVACISSSFLFYLASYTAEQQLYHSSPVDGHLDCVQLLAVMNIAGVNTLVLVFV